MAIEALVQLCARPNSRHHLAWVARSPLMGMADDELDDFLTSTHQDQNLLKSLSEYLGDTPLGSLADRWLDLSQSDRIVQMLEETLDHSDLLIAYPDDSDRPVSYTHLTLPTICSV